MKYLYYVESLFIAISKFNPNNLIHIAITFILKKFTINFGIRINRIFI